ncbi:MAG: glycosyltransferase [Desulfobacteraceae bacterium]|nr:MAG: glycosyltransferase [Desulfobacteraceae bacterium]
MANEITTAEKFIKDVLATCSSYNFYAVKIFVVVDKVSTDGTIGLLNILSETISELEIVYAPENTCVVDAYIRGYKEALKFNCDWILEIDAGFSHQPDDIPIFFETMIEGYDCVFGSRFCYGGKFSNGSFKRYLISRVGSVLTNFLLGTRLRDMTSGFELFSNEALIKILKKGIHSRGPFFQTEIKTYAHRFRIIDVPIRYQSPSHKIGKSALKDAAFNLWRLFQLRLHHDVRV